MPLDRHLNWTPTSGTVCSTHWAMQILSWFLDESTHINAFTQLCGVLVFLQFGQVTNCSKPRLKVGCEFDWAADHNYRWKKSSKPEEKRSCLCSLCRKLSEVEACICCNFHPLVKPGNWVSTWESPFPIQSESTHWLSLLHTEQTVHTEHTTSRRSRMWSEEEDNQRLCVAGD